MADDVEIPLLGGDVTEGVVRVGDTVRRPRSPQSGAIAAYLEALEAAGFAESPRYLGVDAKDRDILTFVEGTTAGRPMEDWAAGPEILTQIAAMQRRLHDATTLDLALPEGSAFGEPVRMEGVPDAYDRADVLGHNDLTPDNLIFRERRLVGVIDFDMAGPTTRLLDIVTTLLYWAPIRDPDDRDPVLRDADSGARMRLYANAYGLDPYDRQRLVDVAVRRQQRSWHIMKRAAETRGGGWARMWNEGVGDVILRSQRWLADNEPALRAALGPKQENPEGFAAYRPDAEPLPTPGGLQVREATTADVDSCVELIMALEGGSAHSWRSMFERTIGTADQALFVADVDGEIIGYARVLSHRRTQTASGDAAPAGYYLMGLVVGDRWRRRGIARALTEARLDWCWARTDRVWYFASADNRASLDAHRGLGFREVTREFQFAGVEFAGGVGVLSVCERPG